MAATRHSGATGGTGGWRCYSASGARRARRAPLGGLARVLGPGVAETDVRTRLARLARNLDAPETRAYAASVLAFESDRRRRLLTGDLIEQLGGWSAETLLDDAAAASEAEG